MRDNQKASKNGKKIAFPEGKAVRLEHVFPDGLRSAFTNHITVQHTDEGEFTVAFFEVDHPVLLGEPEDIAAQVEKLESVKAHCVARIVISEKRMPKFIGALVSNYESHVTSKEQSNPDSQKGKKHAS
jgi:hypothetical protein